MSGATTTANPPPATEVDAATVKRWLEGGQATLIDVREPDEYAREHIAGARHIPLAQVNGARLPSDVPAVIFHCRTGARTGANATRLANGTSCTSYVLEGGLERWKREGLPVVTDRKQPIEIMRQVQIAAGSLVLAGVLLGLTLSPSFYFLSALVGAGLVFAGVSGTCAMARVLALMPWNRRQVR